MKGSEKINILLDYLSLNPSDFARKVGLKNVQNIYDIQKDKVDISKTTVNKIVSIFPNINKNWLLTGEGEMLRKADNIMKENEIIYVPLLPISAAAGSLNDFVVSVKDSECEKIISPIKGVDWAITVSGDSMEPEYPSGSQILIKKINERAFIDWGKVYVLDTCNGSVIKKIFPVTDNPNKLKCVSINPGYPSFDVSLDDVYGVYRVLLCMSVK